MATINYYKPIEILYPGITLSEKIEELGMSNKEFAIRTCKPEKTINAVLKGESSITSDMAIAFETVTKIPAGFWLNSQKIYDEYKSRKKRDLELAENREWAKKFPINDLLKKGWIKPCNTDIEKVNALLSFFSINNYKAWENYFFEKQLKVAFRISLKSSKNPQAISAWLREGEIQFSNIKISNSFSDTVFYEKLPIIKEIIRKQDDNFFKDLQKVCEDMGIKLVYTPCIQKAPINGATRWINNTPCIQLSGRQKRNDIFWFSFFHEIGHIILHGKKDIFLEDIDYLDKEDSKEVAANKFATNILLSEKEEQDILQLSDFCEENIKRLAKKFNTHPGIIVGRLQYKKKIEYSKDNGLIKKIEIN
jgi:HTH-type transcriptional regulator/antitoxin HigA